jgi:hypothetical protein
MVVETLGDRRVLIFGWNYVDDCWICFSPHGSFQEMGEGLVEGDG